MILDPEQQRDALAAATASTGVDQMLQGALTAKESQARMDESKAQREANQEQATIDKAHESTDEDEISEAVDEDEQPAPVSLAPPTLRKKHSGGKVIKTSLKGSPKDRKGNQERKPVNNATDPDDSSVMEEPLRSSIADLKAAQKRFAAGGYDDCKVPVHAKRV